MTEDFPTLLLPMKAYSGRSGFGACLKSGLLMIYFAVLMFTLQVTFRIQDTGYRVQVTGYRLQGAGVWMKVEVAL